MNNIYIIREKDLKTALDQVDNFKTKMELFSNKYPKYKHKVNINKELDEWLVELNINTNDEQTNTQAS